MDQLMREETSSLWCWVPAIWEYESFFKSMQEKYPGRFCACFGFVPELSRKIYAGADMFLMPSKSEPCGLFSDDRPKIWNGSHCQGNRWPEGFHQ